jgi:hypothetical protein
MEKPTFPISVVMQRRSIENRWADHVWEPIGVLPGSGDAAGPRMLVDENGLQQWLHSGFSLVLHRDECEGYYLNVSASTPRVFVLWRIDEDAALPLDVTASSEEGGRWLDAGHSVDGVPMPPEVFAWVGDYVERNYRPEPQKKRIKPRSFLHPKDRVAR